MVHRSPRISIIALALACCTGNAGNPGSSPPSNVQTDVMAPRSVFVPAPVPQSTPAPPAPAVSETPEGPPRFGIAGMAEAPDVQGNVRRGRDFAFDHCRTCHVVAPDQRSATRFSKAPDFQSVANMPSTTHFSLIVWLTNPHPTMPSLILSPQDASDVIAYIESLRTRR